MNKGARRTIGFLVFVFVVVYIGDAIWNHFCHTGTPVQVVCVQVAEDLYFKEHGHTPDDLRHIHSYLQKLLSTAEVVITSEAEDEDLFVVNIIGTKLEGRFFFRRVFLKEFQSYEYRYIRR